MAVRAAKGASTSPSGRRVGDGQPVAGPGPPVDPVGPPPFLVEAEGPADRITHLTAPEIDPLIGSNPGAVV
eukprot:10172853-Alexandrium_andersonii.AAC.1